MLTADHPLYIAWRWWARRGVLSSVVPAVDPSRSTPEQSPSAALAPRQTTEGHE